MLFYLGIDFCYKLEDLLKYCNNSTTAGTYVVQKYIGKLDWTILNNSLVLVSNINTFEVWCVFFCLAETFILSMLIFLTVTLYGGISKDNAGAS